MKEVMAIIRQNMIGKTKNALLETDFPSMTCAKVMGRGKAKVDFSLIDSAIEEGDLSGKLAEQFSEGHRLIAKRLITLVVNDEDVSKVIDAIISVNSTGNPGDGKIFVLPIGEAFRVRTGETDVSAL